MLCLLILLSYVVHMLYIVGSSQLLYNLLHDEVI